MPKTELINGEECRYYIKGKIYISRDGNVAGMQYGVRYSKPVIKQIKIKTDDAGKYIKKPNGPRIPVDLAVMTCYCPPKPMDNKRYRINHKDGDAMNCDANNLEWVIQPYEHTDAPSINLRCYGNIVTVFKDGHVEQDGKPMTIYDSMYDSDVDLEVCIRPHIQVPKPSSIWHERVFLDNLMKIAGYIQGDDSVFMYPKILHIDYDRMNCSSDNLMWVEYNDERLVTYYARNKEDRHKRNIELNPGKSIFQTSCK